MNGTKKSWKLTTEKWNRNFQWKIETLKLIKKISFWEFKMMRGDNVICEIQLPFPIYQYSSPSLQHLQIFFFMMGEANLMDQWNRVEEDFVFHFECLSFGVTDWKLLRAWSANSNDRKWNFMGQKSAYCMTLAENVWWDRGRRSKFCSAACFIRRVGNDLSYSSTHEHIH